MMTQSDTGQFRANRDGDRCPPWCTADHAKLLMHSARTDGEIGGGIVWTLLSQASWDRRPVVAVTSNEPAAACPGYVQAFAGSAEQLAVLLDTLAGLEPGEIARLAAQVRELAELEKSSR
jgi:hypothetical protein